VRLVRIAASLYLPHNIIARLNRCKIF